MTDLRFSLPAAGIAFLCALVVVVRAAAAPAPAPRRAATAQERVAFAASVKAAERKWADEVTQNFPADRWSQSDDFHGKEWRHMTELADKSKVRVEDVLRAVDDDLHSVPVSTPNAPDMRAARAVPCKPRPFYD